MPDVRLSIRSLLSAPLVTAVAVLSLALGIGANTAIFSLTNTLLLRRLPVPDPHQLVTVASDFAIAHGYKNGAGWNYEMWERFERRADAFAGSFAWMFTSFNLASEGEVDNVHGMFASGGFFTTLGVPALLGRVFTPADDVRGGGPDGPVAVISYVMWQRRFGGAADIVGRRLDIGRTPFTIVGVTPPQFFGIEIGESLDVVVPLAVNRSVVDSPAALLLTVMLRLKPEQSLAAATETMRALQPEITDAGRSQLPGFTKEPYVLVSAATGSTDKTQLRQRYELPLLVLTVVVGLVLLIACANIANLLLARATARRHELAVRLALGAPRWRLARQLFVESLVLAGSGAVLGLLLARWVTQILVSQLSPTGEALFLNLALDWRVLGFTAVITVATTLFFGTAPAFRASRVAPVDAMREQGRGASGARHASLSSGLVAAQVAVSLTLVVAAALFVSTFVRLDHVPLGFDADAVLVATVDTARVPVDDEGRQLLRDRLIAALGSTPGVTHAAASLSTPGPGGGANQMTDARGRAVNIGPRVMMNAVTSEWFATYGIQLVAGRDILESDTANGQPVVIVNEAFARRFFPGRSPLGAVFEDTTAARTRRTIVGVVADVVHGSRRDEVGPAAYLPLAQASGMGPPGRTSIQISVRLAGRSMADVTRDVATALTKVNRDLTFRFRVVGDAVDAALAQERLIAILSAFFGVLAVLLAGLGLYGVTAYSVARRHTEIGVRIALGATSAGILRLVLSQAFRVTLIGLILGIVASAWLSRWIAALLFGLGPRDPVTLAAAAALVMAVAVVAAWLPARRALRVNPANLLRDE